MKRNLNQRLSLAFIFILFCLTLNARIITGSCGAQGDNVTYSLDTDSKTLVISGEGDMKDYISVQRPWSSYYSHIQTVTISDGVTSIGYSAFSGCGAMTSITIPNSVTSIGDYVFENCSRLTSVTIPNSVTNIEHYAFYGPSGLTSILVDDQNPNYSDVDGVLFTKDQKTLVAYPAGRNGSYVIPENVTSIKGYAFHNCVGLTSVTISGSVSSIGGSAFNKCSGLLSISVDSRNQKYCDVDGVLYSKDKKTLVIYPSGKTGEYVIPESVTSIGAYAFADCKNINTINIPNNVTTLGNYSFGDCLGLTSVTIGNGVTNIEITSFHGCKSLLSINVDESNPNYCDIDGVLFDKAQTTLIQYPTARKGNYEIPSSVTKIEYRAFMYSEGLSSVTVPNSVSSIGYGAFSSCYGLTTITIPYSMKNIESSTFLNCTSLKSIIIPNSITSIESGAFSS